MSRVNWTNIKSCVDLSREVDEYVHKRQAKTAEKILAALVDRPGVVLADEVGMGKTYVAIAVASAVIAAGGRVQVSVPLGVFQKWVRDFRRCSGWVEGSDEAANKMATPVPLRRYSDIFWYRAGLECCGKFECRPAKCPRFIDGSCADEATQGDSLPLMIWHPGATDFRFVSGNRRATGCNLNTATMVIASMACSRDGVKNSRLWWGDNIESGYEHYSILAERIRFLWKMRNDGGVELSPRLRREFLDVVSGKTKARTWWKPGKANRELGDLVRRDTHKRLWREYAGVPDLLIVDEAHKGKGVASRLNEALELFRAEGNLRVLALTATPFDLKVDELDRLVRRIWLARPQDECNQQAEAVKNAFRGFCDERDRFIDCWENVSRSVPGDAIAEVPPFLKAARKMLLASKDEYVRELGPWMIRHRKGKTPPYEQFAEGLDPSVRALSANPHRNYRQGEKDIIDLSSENASEESFDAFLGLERLEYETRQAINAISWIVGRARRDEILAEMEGDFGTFKGSTHFVHLVNAFDYMKVEDYLVFLTELERRLAEESRDAAWRIKPIIRLAKELKVKFSDEMTLLNHPKMVRAVEVILEHSQPVSGQCSGGKVLLFSFNRAPIKHLQRELTWLATAEISRVLANLFQRLGSKAKPAQLPPEWTGLKSDQLDLFFGMVDCRGRKLGLDKGQFMRAVRVPELLRKKWSRTTDSLLTDALEDLWRVKGRGPITISDDIDEDVVKVGRALLFSPVNLARWATGLKSRQPAAEDLWRFSSQMITMSVKHIFENASASAKSGESGLIPDGGDYSGQVEVDEEHDDDTWDRIRDNLTEIHRLTSEELSWCQSIYGGRSERQKWALQLLFNTPATPEVLLVQSTMCREGIDLHRYCRHVVHYDLEWAPGAMEQREGRVDRVESLWERDYACWRKMASEREARPHIEVHTLRIKDHHDDVRWTRLRRRQAELFAGMGAALMSEMEVRDLKPFLDDTFIEDLLPDFSHPDGFPEP